VSVQSAPVKAESLNTYAEVDPRESMRVLPSILQGPLTLLTGKPFQGQAPWTLTPMYHLTAATSALLIGLVMSLVALTQGRIWLLLLIPGWMLTLHGMRSLYDFPSSSLRAR
jgi:hypothetical protein